MKILRKEVTTGSSANFNINGTIETLVLIENIRIYITVNVQQNSLDKVYTKEFLRTVVDLSKVFNGAVTNPIVHMLMYALKKSVSFPLKFPFAPVVYEFVVP